MEGQENGGTGEYGDKKVEDMRMEGQESGGAGGANPPSQGLLGLTDNFVGLRPQL